MKPRDPTLGDLIGVNDNVRKGSWMSFGSFCAAQLTIFSK